MMDIEKIIEDWLKDAKIDRTDLTAESIRIPLLHGKYLKLYSDARMRLKHLRIKKKTLTQALTDYYAGDLNNESDLEKIGKEPWPKVTLKQDRASLVEADGLMVKMNIKIAYQEELVDVLEEIMKHINQRNFIIKNAIDFLRFEMGG